MNAPKKPLASGTRLQSLDSLRGIAALVVVVYHSLQFIPGWAEDRPNLLREGFHDARAWVWLTPLRVFFAGPAAVLLFFVLSGLVLGLTFTNRDRDSFVPFAIKRVTRIWPVFAIAILTSALLQFLIGTAPVPGVSVPFTYTWGEPLSPDLLVKHLLMTGSRIGLDNPMWSLVHEMRISLIFPLLVTVTLWMWPVALIAAISLALIAVKTVGLLGMYPEVKTIAMTMEFIYLFVAGIVMAAHLSTLQRRLADLSSWSTGVLWIIALAVFSVPPESTETIDLLKDGILLLTCGMASVLIVALCAAEGRAFTALMGPLPIYLGRISYSLYLWHMIIIVTVVRLGYQFAPVPLLILAGIVASIPLADLSQRFLEVPSTRLGRKLSRKLSVRVARA